MLGRGYALSPPKGGPPRGRAPRDAVRAREARFQIPHSSWVAAGPAWGSRSVLWLGGWLVVVGDQVTLQRRGCDGENRFLWAPVPCYKVQFSVKPRTGSLAAAARAVSDSAFLVGGCGVGVGLPNRQSLVGGWLVGWLVGW